jgi:thiamine biosynthesis lipoprotein
LHPATGYPAESGLISATVVAESAEAADALSTALFIAGLPAGLAILQKYPGAQAVLADEKLGVTVTGSSRESFRACPGIRVNYI